MKFVNYFKLSPKNQQRIRQRVILDSRPIGSIVCPTCDGKKLEPTVIWLTSHTPCGECQGFGYVFPEQVNP